MALMTQRLGLGGASMAATPMIATMPSLAATRPPLAMSQPATGFISRPPIDRMRLVVATSARLQMISDSSGMTIAKGTDLMRDPWDALVVSVAAVMLAMAESCTAKICPFPQVLGEIADIRGLDRLDRRKSDRIWPLCYRASTARATKSVPNAVRIAR